MENKESPKVLIACVTDGSQQFCLDNFWKAIEQQDHKGSDILFIDNSEDDDYLKLLEKTGAKVLKAKKQDHAVLNRVEGRKTIKEYFIKNNYDYILLIESDIILPKNALSRLLFHKKDVISGVYLSNMNLGDHHELCPCLYDFAEDGFAKVMELKDIIDEKILEISCAGLGCTLISKNVIEQVNFRFFEQSMAGDDISFFIDARAKGFDAFADTSVKCNRMVKPEGDELNNLFSFDSHPKIRHPKILVGCVTYDKDETYLSGLLDST